jgi:signal peptidase I
VNEIDVVGRVDAVNEAGAENGGHAGNGGYVGGAGPVTSPLSGGGNGLYAAPPTASPPKRRTDYRLRGLDLGAQRQAEAPVRTKRKDLPRIGRRRRLLFRGIIVLAVAVLAGVLIRVTLVQPYAVHSTAMIPTLEPGDRLLVVKSTALAGSIGTGTIVVFHPPQVLSCNTGVGNGDLVERVIGLPGQTIRSNLQTIYVNGHILNEAGWYNPRYGQLGSDPIDRTTVPPGHYFVMADNRTNWCDSRSFGTVPQSSVVGQVVAIALRNGHPHVHFF